MSAHLDNRQAEASSQTVATRQAYAARINAAYKRTVEGIIEIGKTLIEAKDALPHGQFQAMIKADLPFGPRQAEKYLAIARHPLLSNANSNSHLTLPSSVSTLYELSRFEPDELAAAMREMERTKAKFDDESLDIAKLLIKKDVNRRIGHPNASVLGVITELGRPDVTVQGVMNEVNAIAALIAAAPILTAEPEQPAHSDPPAPQVRAVGNNEKLTFPVNARRLPDPGIAEAETAPPPAESQADREVMESRRLAKVYAQEVAKWLNNFKGREQYLSAEDRDSLIGNLKAAIASLEAMAGGEPGGPKL